jgi:hypothetical protein|tara:strand:+ start:3921 stop:4115 length:195 start_codon:yes stop_codon:yes gene_type:complete
MSRIDVTDRDPFANADAEPKDNVTAIGFLTRLVLRFGVYRLVGMVISLLIAKYMGLDNFLRDMI